MLENSWTEILKNEKEKPYFAPLWNKVTEEYKRYTCYPKKENIFRAFYLTDYHDVKVVVIGQDPYINENQAMGLCFSVPEGQQLPPSLVNIYREIESDIGKKMPPNGDLTYLAKQGVFLLNASLTVGAGMSNSHKDFGWTTFTDNIIRTLNIREKPMVFMLWGSMAISKKELITNPKHLILTAPHPSPLSAYRGFFGSKHFSKANEFLEKNHIEKIKWERE